MPHGLSRLRMDEPWLLGPRWVSDTVTYVFLFAGGLVTLPVALPLVVALVAALAFVALWLLLKTIAESLSAARERAAAVYRRSPSWTPPPPWVRTARWVFPPALAEGLANDVYHRREQMAREGARQITIELATTLVYGQAFVGWLFLLVLRVLTVAFPRPRD